MKKREAALKRSEEKYRDLYDNAPDMFVSVDAKTATIVECNRTLVEVSGYTKQEIIGRSIFDMYTPDSAEYARTILFPKFVKTGVISAEELKIKRKDGSNIDVSLNTSAVRDEKETFEKCLFLFKFKEGENFNHRNTLSISRIII